MFRNIGTVPTGTGNVEADLKRGGLDWKTVRTPMASVSPKTGKVEMIPNRFNLHRSDGKGAGKGYLDSCSDQYHPPQNAAMFKMFYQMAQAGGLDLKRIGELRGGRRVFAIAETNRVAQVTSGDPMRLCALMTTGHVPGMAYVLKLFVLRQVCSNGMTIEERAAMFRMSHRTQFSDKHRAKMQAALEAGAGKFGKYMDQARTMFELMFPLPLQENFVAETYQPGLLTSVITETEGNLRHKAILEKTDGLSEKEQGQLVLRAILAHGPVNIPTKALQRSTKQAVQVLNTQPGRSGGNLWNAVNAVTYQVDHLRGRNAETGVEAAYFGAGEQTKNRAQTLAQVVVETNNRLTA
jgi:hypothetical protein